LAETHRPRTVSSELGAEARRAYNAPGNGWGHT
jgi:hypothetical protein